MYLNYYLEKLEVNNIPDFLIKYLNVPSLVRLKKVGYFCGMDYASKDIYDFTEYISRYDHSLSSSLMTYKLTGDKLSTLACLFHDIATPCFSHVIDYMNKDYEHQESTEMYTEKILREDTYLKKCLDEDNIDIEDIIDFKKYTVVDNKRPKLCADRLDGVILTGLGWTKNVTKEDIKNIVEDMCIFKNEDNEDEIGFKTYEVAKKVVEVNNSIDLYCHSKEDNYMMMLLSDITKHAIDKNYFTYEDLYYLDEEEILNILKEKTTNEVKDKILEELMNKFENIKKTDIESFDMPKIKIRKLTPLVGSKRFDK